MHSTRHDLPESTRRQVIDLLAPALAEAIHLHLQAKEAHWNVEPNRPQRALRLREMIDRT